MPVKRDGLGIADCEAEGRLDTPVSNAEQVIFGSDKKPSRYTLTIAYEQCVEHGTLVT